MQANLLETLAQYGHMKREQPPPPQDYYESLNAVHHNSSTPPGDIAIHRALEAITAPLKCLATPPKTNLSNPNDTPLTINPRTGRPYKRY